MPRELGQVRVVPVLQDEGVALSVEHDCLMPPILKGLLGDHQVTSRNVVPGPGQATSSGEAVLIAVLAQCSLRFETQSGNNVCVKRLADVKHQPSAVAVKT